MSSSNSISQALQSRFVRFAKSVLDLSGKLPRTPQGRHITDQVLRSGTAVAANYAEARAAESRQDFIHKLRIVQKELNETAVWLQLIKESQLSHEDLTEVIAENEELCRIIAASIRTAGGFPK